MAWTISVKGNDIIMQRNKPVKFSRYNVNAPVGAPARGRRFEGTYRLTLRFAPEMSFDEYEKLLAENVVSESEDHKLQQKHHVSKIFGEIRSFTEEEKKREQAYREEAGQLVFHRLPHFYTPDYSVTLYQSWSRFEDIDSGNKPWMTNVMASGKPWPSSSVTTIIWSPSGTVISGFRKVSWLNSIRAGRRARD